MDVHVTQDQEHDVDESARFVPDTVSYVVDSKTVEKLHTQGLRYRLLYREACRRLNECQVGRRTLDGELGKALSLNRGLTMEKSCLQNELDRCHKSKMDIQNLFHVFYRTINVSNEQINKRQMYYEKRELNLLQEKLLLQESKFDRYERESAGPTTPTLGAAASLVEAPPSTQDLNLRLSFEKLERELVDLQGRLDTSEISNNELIHVIGALEAEREKISLDLKRCQELVDALNDRLSDVEKEKIDLLDKEKVVLRICEREKNEFKVSLEKCRERLFQSEADLENAVQAGKTLEHELSIVNQDLAAARQAMVVANQNFEADTTLLTKKNENLTINCVRVGDQVRQLTAQNDKLRADLSLCQQEINTLKESEQLQQLGSADVVKTLTRKIELNNAEYLKNQKDWDAKVAQLKAELRTAKNDYRLIKREKSELSDTNDQLHSRVQVLTGDIADLQKLKDFVNRFISENYSFIIDLDIPASLSKIKDEYQDCYRRLEELKQHNKTLDVAHHEASAKASQFEKLSGEQRSELNKLDALLDELRLENNSLKTAAVIGGGGGGGRSPSGKSSSDREGKLKRFCRAQLAVKRAEINQLVKKIHDLRRSRRWVHGEDHPPAAVDAGPGRAKVVELELEILRLRDDNRTSFRAVCADYQSLLEGSVSERRKLTDELERLRDSNELHAQLSYHTLVLEHLSNAVASIDTEDCPEGLIKLVEIVRDARDRKLNVSRLRTLSSAATGHVSAADMALFQNVQSGLAADELQSLRVTQMRYDVLVSAMEHLLASGDTTEIASTLFEYRVMFARGGLLELTNYLTTEHLDTRILKERGDAIHILSVYFGSTHFSPQDVSSLVETLNSFGGREFVQSMKRVVALKDVHPEYGALLTLLRDTGASDQIDDFVIWLKLTNDIRLNHPHENNFEELKHNYIRDNLNQLFGLQIESLEQYFYVEGDPRPRRRKIPKRPAEGDGGAAVGDEVMDDDWHDCFF